MASSCVVYVIFVAALVTLCLANLGPTEFTIEEPCSRAGGNCLLKEECPVEIAKKYMGLCPEQQSKGAECCHGISLKEYRCRQLGGECFSKTEACEERFQISRATDCSSDELCCLLV